MLFSKNYSFMELLKIVEVENHGTLGYHLRTLREFIKIDPLTEKYSLSEKGELLASCIQDLDFIASMRRKPSEYVQNLTVGEHTVAFYETDEYKHQILTPFFRTGFQRGEAVVYLAPESRLTEEKRTVEKLGMTVDPDHREAFTILSADDWYLNKGKADCKVIVHQFLSLLKRMNKAGFKGLRLAGDLSPFYDYSKTAELMEYEESLGRQFAFNVCAMCLYDWNRFDRSQFKQIFSYHGHIVSKTLFGSTDLPIMDAL